ncbi:MAG: hypothetical protein ACRDRG_22030 [Pseudonocardiaceae bacterium]
MSRRGSLILAAYALAIVGVIYALSLVPTVREVFAAVRYRDDALAVVARMGSFFVPLAPQDSLADEMHPWMWLPQLVFIGSLTVLVYFAGRMMTASTSYGRIGLLLMGAVMLAGGLADMTGRAIATWRHAFLAYQDAGSSALELSLYDVNIIWEPEALILSIWLGILMFLATVVLRQRMPVVNHSSGSSGNDLTVGAVDPTSTSTGSHETRVQDVPGLASKLATLGIIPVLSASLVGGINLYSSYSDYSGDLDLRRSFLNTVLSDFAFYLKLRSSPPTTGSFDYSESYGTVAPGQWLLSGAIAMIFVAFLWLILRSVVASWGLPAVVPGATVVLAAWGMTVLVGAFVGVLDDLVGTAPTQLVDLNLDLLSYDQDLALFDGMLFGVLWGWLVGLMVLLGYRRTRIPAAALT